MAVGGSGAVVRALEVEVGDSARMSECLCTGDEVFAVDAFCNLVHVGLDFCHG